MIVRNHSNMLICCSIIFIILKKIMYYVINVRKSSFLKILIFCKFINIFTFSFDQINTPMLNKSNKKLILTPILSTVVYVSV